MSLASNDPWAGYARLVVTIRVPGLGALAVRGAASGEADEWPFASPDPVYVLTAWDPGGTRGGQQANRRRQASLESELRPVGVALWPARGFDPVSGGRDEGVAVQGMAEEVVRDAGLRYGQDALFAWTAASWSIVACAGDRRVRSGWSLTRPEPG